MLTSGLPLDAKLSALVLGSDSPVVGPHTAAALRTFAAEPEPPMVTQDEVETMLAKLAMATAQAKLTDAETDERMSLYWLALKDLPVADLRAAFVDLLRTSKFLPTPAEIHKAASAKGSKRRHAKSRARHLVWLHERDWKPVADVIPPEELAGLLAATKIGAEVTHPHPQESRA